MTNNILPFVKTLHITWTHGRMIKLDSPISPYSAGDIGQMVEHSSKCPWPQNNKKLNSPICHLALSQSTYDHLTALPLWVVAFLSWLISKKLGMKVGLHDLPPNMQILSDALSLIIEKILFQYFPHLGPLTSMCERGRELSNPAAFSEGLVSRSVWEPFPLSL